MADAVTATEKKDLLLSQGAHEIRTPASVILGYVRMLTTDRLGPLTDMQRNVLEHVANSTLRIAALAEEMSVLARLLEGGITFAGANVEIAALIAAEIPSVAPALDGDVRYPRDRQLRGRGGER
jgi:signal transduction histidine kinase